MAVVVFNPAAFIVRYPEFSAVSVGQLTAFFDEAGLYLSNTDCSPVQNIIRRTLLLNMLTAHVGKLSGALDVDGEAGPVGQVLSAAEGSVNASFANVAPEGGSKAWYAQTSYGLSFWNAVVNLRGFHYSARPTIVRGSYADRFGPGRRVY